MGPYEQRSGVMPGEQRDPAVNSLEATQRGRGEMIKPSVSLQDLSCKIYLERKAEINWNRWSRAW